MRIALVPVFLSVLCLAGVAAADEELKAEAPSTPVAVATAVAVAELKDAKGKLIGEATLRQLPAGLLISASLKGLPPGPHAFHIHETGKCEAPSFKLAGGHFNPSTHQHGFENPKGAHAGDLPNLFVPVSGEVKVEVLNATGATLEALFANGGGALVLHASGDDYHTDPAGAAGDRIACGVIRRK